MELAARWLLMCGIALVLAFVHASVVVSRLPEPDDGATLGKRSYATLGTTGEASALSLAVAAAQIVCVLQPQWLWPVWLVAGSSLLVLVWVDALTTWLPTSLLWLVSAEFAGAVALSCLLSPEPTEMLKRMGIGAVGSAILFGLVWLLSRGGLGFGDVRLAPLIGAIAASTSLDSWHISLLAGSLAGVILALVPHKAAPGTKSGFAYAPSMLAGPYLAWVWLALTS